MLTTMNFPVQTVKTQEQLFQIVTVQQVQTVEVQLVWKKVNFVHALILFNNINNTELGLLQTNIKHNAVFKKTFHTAKSVNPGGGGMGGTRPPPPNFWIGGDEYIIVLPPPIFSYV